MVLWPLAALAAASLTAAPAALPRLETSVAPLRSAVDAAKAERLALRAGTLAQEIPALASELQRLSWDADRARSTLRDLRWRAQRHQQPGGRPPTNQDPFFSSDLRRAVWTLRDLASAAGRAEAWAARLNSAAVKDPALVAPAERLAATAQRFESDARWLESDARWASYDFRRAGFSMEAWDAERYSGDAHRSAQQASGLAGKLLSAVRP